MVTLITKHFLTAVGIFSYAADKELKFLEKWKTHHTSQSSDLNGQYAHLEDPM